MKGHFANLDGRQIIPRAADLVRWQLGWHEERRPKTPATGVDVPAVNNNGSALSTAAKDTLTWIGHASFLVQLGGTSVLIDPVLSPSLGPGFRRNVAPGIDYPNLPKIDAVLITHDHRDHLDERTVRKLGPDPLYIVPRGLGRWFRKRGLRRVCELQWWQSHDVGRLQVTFVPSEHWSRRGLFDTNDSWWGGYVLEYNGLRLYHSGDTAWFDGFETIGQRCGPIEAALLPIGAYAPRWFMKHQHMNPEDAVRAFSALGANQFVAMHWGTFKLTDEPLLEPPTFLAQVWEQAGLAENRKQLLPIGATLTFR